MLLVALCKRLGHCGKPFGFESAARQLWQASFLKLGCGETGDALFAH